MLIFIGGGGHSKVLYDTVLAQNRTLYGYTDSKPQAWLDEQNIKHISDDNLSSILGNRPELFIAFVGADCESLNKRATMMKEYQEKGAYFTPLIHPTALVSKRATISIGVQILPHAVVNSGAVIGEGAVINSGAIVEHDAVIGAGAHIAPRAVVLGGANVGEYSYIGSGAVIVQNSVVPPSSFIKALTVYK
ncbi:MAG: hypothetical protein AABY33_09455 [Pseudomonadota bacterium]